MHTPISHSRGWGSTAGVLLLAPHASSTTAELLLEVVAAGGPSDLLTRPSSCVWPSRRKEIWFPSVQSARKMVMYHSHTESVFLKLENSCLAQQVSQIPQGSRLKHGLRRMHDFCTEVRASACTFSASLATYAKAWLFSLSLEVTRVSSHDLCIIVERILLKEDILIKNV